MKGEAVLSNTYYEMSESSGKIRKSYVDYPKDRSKLTCLIHGPGHSSDECKVLVEFGFKYYKSMATKDCRHDSANNEIL